MKKIFLMMMMAGFLWGCAGSGSRSQENAEAVVLEAEVEAVLEQNIELNERLSKLENELDSLLNVL